MTLVIPNFTNSESGEYLCVASDGQQFVNHAFNLTITAGHSSQIPTTKLPITTTISKTTPATALAGGPPHVILIDIKPKIIHFGDNVTATCHVKSYPKYDIINWDVKTSEIPTNIEAISGNYSALLRINNFQRINEVPYRCSVKNSFGEDSRIVNILSSH
ncbi:uncharacterized protein LOC134262446 [Saccostrea cucullata]|uniref:uncharacterized protein LOC134262446 n=1 Tax=Saccostrea cuccullata TaxID=36930 RepID=UPI002ED2EFB6